MLRNLFLVIFLSFVAHFCFAQSADNNDIKKVAPPATASAPVSESVPTTEAASFDTPSGSAINHISPFKFNLALWLGALSAGAGSFGIFLVLHRSRRVARDWAWPYLFAVFFGYAAVMGVTVVNEKVYDDWSSPCLKLNSFDKSNRSYEDVTPDGVPTVDSICANAQVEHSALGLKWVVEQTRKAVAGGLAKPLFLGEMKFLIWFVLAVWGAAIYSTLLFIRQRFFLR